MGDAELHHLVEAIDAMDTARNRERARLIAETAAKNQAAQEARRADREGVVGA